MRPVSKVNFFLASPGFSLRKRTVLKAFIEGLFRKEKKGLLYINYIFCSDKRLLDINRTYLKHDYLTDIISFDLSNDEKTIGEIYISIDRVRENAQDNGVSFNNELHRVIFHGALHLCGYKDKKRADQLRMRKGEDKYLSLYGFK